VAVSHYAFRLLALPEQLTIVWQESTFLATRWEEEDAVNLYYMEGGFFAEVFYDQHQEVPVRTRTFTSRKCLEDYTPYIRLEDLEKEKPPMASPKDKQNRGEAEGGGLLLLLAGGRPCPTLGVS